MDIKYSDLLKDLTENQYGILNKVFIIEAVRYYSNLVLQNEKPKDHGTEMISQISWWEIANNMKNKLETNFEEQCQNKH